RQLSLELSHDGVNVLVAGDDGVVRIDTLATGASRTVLELHEPAHATFAGNDQVVAWTAKRLVIAGVKEVALASPIVELHSQWTAVFWCDEAGAAWVFAFGETAPHKFAVPDRITHIALNGSTTALGGEQRLWLADGAGIRESVEGKIAALA